MRGEATALVDETAVWARGRLGKAGGAPRILFGQVREDAAIELGIARELGPGQTFFCIASGGCTAFSLLAASPAAVHAVDINPAQNFLVELKKAALRELPREAMLGCLLRDARPAYPRLSPHLSAPAQAFWDGQTALLALGLNNCGLIDIRLQQLRQLLPLVQSRRQVRRLFAAASPRRQHEIYRRHWDHWRWRLVFKLLLNRMVLSLVYGPQFTGALPAHFADEFRSRVERTLLAQPLAANPYAWSTFVGGYPTSQANWPPYLQPQNEAFVRAGLSQTSLTCADAAAYLEDLAPNSVSFFALSNILEIASPQYAQRLLAAVVRGAQPGARVGLRSIFGFDHSVLRTMPRLQVRPSAPTAALEASDRSFFCSNLRILDVL